MKVLKKFFLLLSLSLSLSAVGFSQQYTLRDQEEIAYQAQLTLNMYNDLLNVISYEGLASESEIKELIRNSYSHSKRQLFYSATAIIEDNIKPSNLVSQHKQDKTIKDYLHYFDLAYVKNEGPSIEFYDYQPSHLKFSNYLYIKVKYTCLFKGKHKEDPGTYKAVDRVAELRVERRDNQWKTFISSIVFYNPEKPITSSEHDIALKNVDTEKNTLSHLSEQVNKGSAKAARDINQSGEFSEKKKAQDSLFNHHMEVGERALAADKLEEAFAAFSEAEKINPFHQDLWQKLLELTKAQNDKISSVDNRYATIKLNADKAYTARNYLKARNLYSEALRLRPGEDNLKVIIEKLERTIREMALLESKYAVGDYKAAIKDYHKAIKKDRNNPDFYHGRGKCYEKLNAIKEAFKDYTKAIELDGNFIEALKSRARLYTETRQYHKAVADYTLILANRDYAAAFYPERARVKKKMGDLNGAIADYQEAIRLNPQVADHHFEKGMILVSQQKKEEAVRSFSEAIEQDPEHVPAVVQRGLAYAASGNLQAASADFERARALGLDEAQQAEINKLTLMYYAKGEGAMEEKNYHRALEGFKEALLISPAFGRAWLRAGDTYYMLEDYDNALLNYEKAAAYDRISFGYFKRGLAYQQKGDEQSAGDDFKRYIPIGKEILARAENPPGNEKPGTSLQKNFVEERAEACYALGYAQLMTHQYVEALENLDMAIHIRKFFPRAYFARGAALYALEDYKRAVKNMEESIKMGLSDPLVFYSLGKAYVANDQLKDAVYSYSHAIKIDPEYEAAYQDRAFCYKSLREYGLALDDLNEALSLNKTLKGDVAIMTNKGLLELYQNRLREANQSFDQALRLDENDGWALYGKACALAKEQKLEESLEWYRKAFQTRQIDWSSIKNDPLIDPVSKQKSFKKLVKTYL
jgi:tetratricopeptide (TPR) repeat protein